MDRSVMLPHNPLVIEDGFCTICNQPAKLVKRHNGEHPEHYDITNLELPEQDEKTAKKLKDLRKGKKTVAFVGMNPRTCSLAPFKEKGVEIWGVNEMHAFYWMIRADRWFQIHREGWTQEVAKRGIRGHYEWLKLNEWNIPIYMRQRHEEIPISIPYPMPEICEKFLKNFRRGDEKTKYFTSSFAYCMGLALFENFERMEIYGYEMNHATQFASQKPCAEFWIGLALGQGVEIYTPPDCSLLNAEIYGE